METPSIFAKQLLAGQHAVVTGGGSGINLAIARRMAQHGANLTLVGRTQAKLDAAVSGLAEVGGEGVGLAADVRDADALDRSFHAASQRFGPIDMVVAGAAGNFPCPASDLSPNGFSAVVNIDLMGTFHTFRLAYPLLRRPGARLLAISAPQAQRPMALQAHACAAKAGVEMLVKTLALEWGPAGVRVNALSPGPIDQTEGLERLAPTAQDRRALEASLPLKRLGTLDDIADGALFLLSAGASYLTGHTLAVDGGRCAS